MDRGRSKGEDFEFQCSWAPPTPFKTILPNTQPIHAEMQEKQQNEADWFGLERLAPGFAQEAQASRDISNFHSALTCTEVIGGVNDLETAAAEKGKIVIASDTGGICLEPSSIDALDRWNMPFADLLALADAASAASGCAMPDGSSGPAGQSRIFIPNCHLAGSQAESSSASMLLGNHNLPLGSNLWFNGNCATENNGLPVPYRHLYDLNFPPGTLGNTVSSMAIPQFAPMTPDKVGRPENNQVSAIQDLHAHEKENQERNGENEVDATRVDTNLLQGPPEQVNSSVLAVSTPSKDNHNSDEGGSQKIDLNKTPQQKPRRRKHRPKVVREDKPKQTPKPATSKENPTSKRKYVRKKGVNKPTTPPAEVSSEFIDPKTLEPARKSCRRALNFNIQGQQQDESSTRKSISGLDSESRTQDLCRAEVQQKSSVQLGQGIHEMVENSQVGIANDSTSSVRGKNDQVTVDDKQEDIARNTLKNNSPSAPRSPNDSTCSTSAVLTEGVQSRGSKRKYSRVVEEVSNTNMTGVHYNILQAYERIPWVHFPNIYKKKRSEKGQNSTTSSSSSCLTAMKNAMQPPTACHQNDAKANPFAPKGNYWNSAPQVTASGIPAIPGEPGREGLQAKQRTVEYILTFTQQERLTKKRSRARTRVRDLASLNRLADYKMQSNCSATQRFENSQQPHTCIEALVADMQPTLAKRKRSKNITSPSSSASSNRNKMQLQKIVLYKHHHSFVRASGSPEAIWKGLIDAVTEQFKFLDINRENDRIIYQDRNALVPYNPDQNALVLYRRDGTIVPFEGPFNPIRKRRPRPKVELDEETNRVWKLLLENINNEGIDGTDEEKRRWWKEERRVFKGRADSFIARMHLVQGDRRFSRWKGSVVDSVIGVFLTQNVSDHLSSSAFMSLAARFPLKSESNHNTCHEEERILFVKEPEVCILDSEQTIEWKKKMPSQRVCDQSSMTLHDSEHNEEKEVVDSILSPGIKIKSSLLNYSESDVEIYHDSTTQMTRTETASFGQDRRATDDVVSSQNSVNSSQNTVESFIAQTAEIIISETNSEAARLRNRLETNNLNCPTSFTELLKMAGSIMQHEVFSHRSEDTLCDENSKDSHSTSEQSVLTAESASQSAVQGKIAVNIQESLTSYNENNQSSNLQGDENVIIQSQSWFDGEPNAESLAQEQNSKVQQTLNLPSLSGETLDVTESTTIAFDNQRNAKQKTGHSPNKALKEVNAAKQKSRRVGREIKNEFDWDSLRREVEANGKKREKTPDTMDSLDWEAVRCADVNEIAETIKERGMNNMLAERIKAFLNRLVSDHGSIDLEWLRDISPDKAKEYLLSIRGLGLKSVECVRLLTLHHLAFPVDTNVGRIAVRLGWVPLQPLPESLQLHLLELYPVLESIQRYLWPRLCKLEQKQLYELHYQMITFGKVFCTKSKPNCNACPMRGECRHFASAFASARLALPAPEEKSIVTMTEKTTNSDTAVHVNGLSLPPPEATPQLEANLQLEASLRTGEKSVCGSCEPIIEEPATPEPECTQDPEHDIEDTLYDDPDEIPTIKLNIEEFTQNLQNYMQKNMELQEGEMSKALVALTPEAASIPMPKLKNVSRLRTEHQVYELPDSHPLLEGMDKREPDDPCSYLLAIWTPGETADSIQPPEGTCSYQESGKLCDQKTCFACNSIREANSQMVRGTLLIPCRTAMRGSFPLNGTYFQVNEVFADHDSSLNPIDVPRAWIWNLPRRTVYFGTSVPSIFKGLPTEGIQHCFWRGYVCVRGFDQKTRAPRPLMARLHFPASKLTKAKGKPVDE